MLPDRCSRVRLNRSQRPTRVPAVAVQLLEDRLRASDARLCDRVVGPGDDALQALRLGEKRRVLDRRLRQLEELLDGILNCSKASVDIRNHDTMVVQ